MRQLLAACRSSRIPAFTAVIAVALLAPLATAQLSTPAGCTPDWQSAFLGIPGPDWSVFDTVVFDDGSGPALYAAGDFEVVAGTQASRIARWDGVRWTPLGDGLDSIGRAMLVWDDGGGEALYVGGTFTTAGGQAASGVARWDGQAWSSLGAGVGGEVHALALYDDGGGTALYAAGEFATAGGAPAGNVARWDGSTWSALGAGVDDTAYAIEVLDDGGGAELCVGGAHEFAGGIAAAGVASWDGSAWKSLGAGLDGQVRTLLTFDDGTGEELYAGGYLFSPLGIPNAAVQRWDGAAWEVIGIDLAEWILALEPYDDGSGTKLHAAGVGVVATWDGALWTKIVDSSQTNFHRTMCGFDDGSGAGMRLFLGGTFDDLDWEEIRNLGAWNGTKWAQVSGGLNDLVHELRVFDDGTGPALYAAGEFTGVGPDGADFLARWDGAVWREVGGGVDNVVRALEVYDDGSGSALYAGGSFLNAGGQEARRIAKWDGVAWSPLGSGVGGDFTRVEALAVFDDGGGAELIAAGDIWSVGGVSTYTIARWDGTDWHGLPWPYAGRIGELHVSDLGAGSALYAGQDEPQPGPWTYQVARWDGATWTTLGAGMSHPVEAMIAFDDGGGPELYAAGQFHEADGVTVNGIARWDGHAWRALADGGLWQLGGVHGLAFCLGVHDDGGGDALYVGGVFDLAGGLATPKIARWDGAGWTAFAASPNSSVLALESFDGGGGSSLYVGGLFDDSPAGDAFLTRWGCATSSITTLAGCFGNPALLTAETPDLVIGASFTASLQAGLNDGIAALRAGLQATDGAGCGLLLPGFGELLLAVTPQVELATTALTTGRATFVVPIPSDPTYVGVEIALQAAAVITSPSFAVELSNGLVATIGE